MSSIRPSRWDKDRAFERRCREEGIRVGKKKTHEPSVQLMHYGKFEGIPVTEVPDWYIEWCVKQKWCFDYVVVECVRRGTEYRHLPKVSRPKYKRHLQKTGQWETKTAKSSGTVTVGQDYEWARSEWEDAGGDASQCPFGEDYVGPELRWENGQPIIFCPVKNPKFFTPEN